MFKFLIFLISNLQLIPWTLIGLYRLRGIRRNIRLHCARGEFEKEREEILRASNVWSKDLCGKISVDIRVEGDRRLPDGPVLLVSNHESYADIPLLFAAVPDKSFGFVAKSNLRKLPLYGKWIAEIHSIFLDRGDVRSSLRTIEEGVSLLENGYSLAIFPEGTRSKGGPIGEFKKGSLRLATKAGVPIVPITLSGSYKIAEETGRIQNNTVVRFFIHPPIATAGMSKQEANAINEKVERLIAGKLAEWRGEEGEGAPASRGLY